MWKLKESTSRAVRSMQYRNVVWCSESSFEYEGEDKPEDVQVIENALDATSSYLDYVAKISGFERVFSRSVTLPIPSSCCRPPRSRRTARTARSAVRQTFASRKAAKSADSGGGSSDPDGRRPHTETNTSNTHSHFFAFLFGGAK